MSKSNLVNQIKVLRLQPGDVLVLQRGFSNNVGWSEALNKAGKAAGIDFEVPIVFVDNIKDIAVVRRG